MKGFLFIGDPHVSSRRPGRRIDDYTSSVIEKLRLAGELARERDLVPVILGDLLHRANENDLSTLARLTTVLKSYPMTPIVLGGNHDKAETLLRDADALYLLAAAGTVTVIDGPCQEVQQFNFEGQTVSLWMAPYKSIIPATIDAPGADWVVLVTHHDLAFAGSYPLATPLHEIKGCDFVVNGHLHKMAPSVVMGETVWHNPGNIEPLSIDCIDHEPAVWSWEARSGHTNLERHLLPHVRDCFELAGILVPQASAIESVEAILPTGTSQFAELLAARSHLEAPRADEADSFIVELRESLGEIKASSPVCAILMALAERAPVPDFEGQPDNSVETGLEQVA